VSSFLHISVLGGLHNNETLAAQAVFQILGNFLYELNTIFKENGTSIWMAAKYSE